jgi:Holliday junction resolvase
MSGQYENDLAKRIYRETWSQIRAYRCGYSGSNAMPQPDILVTDPSTCYAVELKGPLSRDHIYVDEDDLAQLTDCQNGYTRVALAVKFQRRELAVINYFESMMGGSSEGFDELSLAEKFVALAPDSLNPSTTDSGNLRLEKPSLDDWPSATAGSSDVDALLSGLGVAREASTTIDSL